MNEQLKMNIDKLAEYIDEKKVKAIREMFEGSHAVDSSEIIGGLELKNILFVLKILPKEVSAEIFTYLEQDKKEEIIKAFSAPEIKEMLENIYSDDIIDFIEDLPANLVKKILQSATEETRTEINMLLSYKENTAGSIMSTDFVELKIKDSVRQAISKIKKQGKMAETINTCYVVNSKRVLVGTIELKEFLFEDEKLVIEDIMESDIVSVATSIDQEEVANIMKKYDITVIPVVNDEQRLIGIITIDDIIDILQEEATEDIHKMAAVSPIEESYLKAGVFDLVKSRLPWLLISMISGAFTGAIISFYENQLLLIPALAGFIPMLMGTAGNAGSQASTMVIRGIVVDGLRPKDLWKVLGKEMVVSFICALVLFGVNYLRISLFPSSLIELNQVTMVALTVSLSLIIAMTVGKLLGGVLPLIVYMFKLDPAAVAAPVTTNIADALSLFIYFQVAVLLLKL